MTSFANRSKTAITRSHLTIIIKRTILGFGLLIPLTGLMTHSASASMIIHEAKDTSEAQINFYLDEAYLLRDELRTSLKNFSREWSAFDDFHLKPPTVQRASDEDQIFLVYTASPDYGSTIHEVLNHLQTVLYPDGLATDMTPVSPLSGHRLACAQRLYQLLGASILPHHKPIATYYDLKASVEALEQLPKKAYQMAAYEKLVQDIKPIKIVWRRLPPLADFHEKLKVVSEGWLFPASVLEVFGETCDSAWLAPSSAAFKGIFTEQQEVLEF